MARRAGGYTRGPDGGVGKRAAGRDTRRLPLAARAARACLKRDTYVKSGLTWPYFTLLYRILPKTTFAQVHGQGL